MTWYIIIIIMNMIMIMIIIIVVFPISTFSLDVILG